MEITLKDHLDAWAVSKHLYIEINDCSRFKAQVEVLSDKRIKIRNIRLKESKKFCGSHPFACDIDGGRKANYLEGADWVEVNDRVNDVLDRLNAIAYVRTSICILRKGEKRRVKYDGHWVAWAYNNEGRFVKVASSEPLGDRPHPEWNRDESDPEAYQDWRLKVAPNSWYPPGTPGTYERKPYVVVPGDNKFSWKKEEVAHVG